MLINPKNKMRFKYPPLGILYLAAVLKQNGFDDVAVFDANAEDLSIEAMSKLFLREKPDLVGISSMAFTFAESLMALRLAKRMLPSVFTVMGGVFPTNDPEQCLRHDCCDSVVIGEGEVTFPELCSAVRGKNNLSGVEGAAFKENGRIVINRQRKWITDLDTVPFPAYECVNVKHYVTPVHYAFFTSAKPAEPMLPIFSSRGCPYKCLFCQVVLGNRIRRRSPENVLSEVRHLQKEYGFNRFQFLDALFTYDRKWAKKLCSLLIEEGVNIKWFCLTRADLVDEEILSLMKKAGCELIFYGVESGSQKALDSLNKNISLEAMRQNLVLTRKCGIKTFGNFIIGAPGDSAGSIDQTISFARKYLDMASFSAAMIFPNTGLKVIAEKESGGKLFNEWDKYTDDDIPKIIYIPRGLTYRQISRYVRKAFFVFYSNPALMLKMSLKIFFSRNTGYFIRNMFQVIKHLTVILTFKNAQEDKNPA